MSIHATHRPRQQRPATIEAGIVERTKEVVEETTGEHEGHVCLEEGCKGGRGQCNGVSADDEVIELFM